MNNAIEERGLNTCPRYIKPIKSVCNHPCLPSFDSFCN